MITNDDLVTAIQSVPHVQALPCSQGWRVHAMIRGKRRVLGTFGLLGGRPFYAQTDTSKPAEHTLDDIPRLLHAAAEVLGGHITSPKMPRPPKVFWSAQELSFPDRSQQIHTVQGLRSEGLGLYRTGKGWHLVQLTTGLHFGKGPSRVFSKLQIAQDAARRLLVACPGLDAATEPEQIVRNQEEMRILQPVLSWKASFVDAHQAQQQIATLRILETVSRKKPKPATSLDALGYLSYTQLVRPSCADLDDHAASTRAG